MFTSKAQVDTLRTLAFGSIGSSYTAIGTPFVYQPRIICFTNTTNQDVLFSNDNVNDKLIVPAGSFKLFDLTANCKPVNQDDFCFTAATQWYVKYTSSPASGAVYIEVIYAQPS